MTIDEWKNDFKGYVNALNIQRDDYNGIMEYIDELPCIYAIPIDWLKKKYPLTGVYGTESYFRTAHIVDELIKEWEAETEV